MADNMNSTDLLVQELSSLRGVILGLARAERSKDHAQRAARVLGEAREYAEAVTPDHRLEEAFDVFLDAFSAFEQEAAQCQYLFDLSKPPQGEVLAQMGGLLRDTMLRKLYKWAAHQERARLGLTVEEVRAQGSRYVVMRSSTACEWLCSEYGILIWRPEEDRPGYQLPAWRSWNEVGGMLPQAGSFVYTASGLSGRLDRVLGGMTPLEIGAALWAPVPRWARTEIPFPHPPVGAGPSLAEQLSRWPGNQIIQCKP